MTRLEPARLSLSNTPLPRPGAVAAGAQSSSVLGPGSVPQPDVQAWIERARESIQALGAFVEGEEDIEEQEEGSTEDDEYLDSQEDEHIWRDLPTDQDTDTEEGGIAVEESDDVDRVQGRSLHESSPATTIRSASREGSAPPQAAGSNQQGSKSPKNAPLSGTSSGSRGSSVGVEQSDGPTSDVSSPRSISTMTGKSRFGEKILGDESPAGHGLASTSDGEYGAVAPGFFAPRRGSVPDPTRLAPARHPVPHILMRGIATPQEVESLFETYFDKMNLSCSLLDPILYTAQTTYWRSPFLFTWLQEVASTVDERSSSSSEHVAASLHSDNMAGGPNSEGDGKLPISQIDDASHQVNEEEIPSERDGDEQALNVLPTTEEIAGDLEENSAEQSESAAAQQVCVQPPPPIFLSLQVASAEGDQPDFVLFNLPESGSHTTEEPLLLLQHHPSLFYEPVSAVFDAFRQEEYFSHLEELSEAEMALNAHELQLVISEDNIHSREVSLQDLYAMHQGVGLPGYLRLTLQSIMPRFITRYNLLRDQVTRLVLGEEAGETRQQEGPAASYKQQVPAAPDEIQESLVQKDETNGSEAAEAAEHSQEVATLDSTSHPDERAEEPAPETEDGNETEQNTTDAIAEGAEDNLNEGSEHDEDASGESDDAAYDLDADAMHAPADDKGGEPSPDEKETEYAGETETHEEGDEGYGDDFQEDGADGTGTAEAAVESTAFSETAQSEANVGDDQHESEPEPNDAQSGQISVSHSTSTSSFDADESSWEDAAGEDDDSRDVEEETNQSIQQVTATVFDEEGKLTNGAVQVAEEGGDDFGDEFGDDDFGDEDYEESAEGTLADPNEEIEELLHNIEASEHVEKDADPASREVLVESENFVSNLENEIDANDAKEKTVLSESVRTESHDHPVTTTDASPEPDLLHKISSKR
ncbi:hypothetical protein ACEPAG_7576 [Sanghuangporus baumii]